MAKHPIVQGATSIILEIFVQDSLSTTGAGLTGLTSGSSGLTCYYHINTAAAAVAVSLTSMTIGTFTSSGFVEVSSANMPGIYQLCLPNAAYASGTSVSAFLKGATNMSPLALEISITQTNVQDAVRGGMTALPNVVAAGNGGLPTVDASNAVKVQSGTGANQISLSSGLVRLSTTGAGDIWDIVIASHLTAGTTGAALNAAGSLGDPWATAVPGAYGAGTAGSIVGTNLNATVSSRSTYAGGAVASVTGAVGSVTGGVTVTTNNDKTGYSLLAGQLQVKKNQALAGFSFPMYSSTSHQGITGRTVTAVRVIDAGAVTACTNAVSEIGSGFYKIDFAAADLNGTSICVKFSAVGADDLYYTFVPQA